MRVYMLIEPEAREPPSADAQLDALYSLEPDDQAAGIAAAAAVAAMIRELALCPALQAGGDAGGVPAGGKEPIP